MYTTHSVTDACPKRFVLMRNVTEAPLHFTFFTQHTYIIVISSVLSFIVPTVIVLALKLWSWKEEWADSYRFVVSALK